MQDLSRSLKISRANESKLEEVLSTMRASAAALNDENASLKLRLEVARKNEQKLEVVEGELRDFYSL